VTNDVPLDPPRDIALDDWLVPDGDELQALADQLFDEMEASGPQRSRVRRDAAERRYTIVANLVANFALLTAYHPHGLRLMDQAGNLATLRYDSGLYSKKAFMQVVRMLEELGLVVRQRGCRGGPRTSLEPSERLRACLPPRGASPRLRRLQGGETIILKARTGRNRPKVLVNYEDTQRTGRMRRQVERINRFLSGHSITLGGQVCPPVHLVRMFLIEAENASHRFTLHGRLYGGQWQYMKREERQSIRIDGEPLVELDFVGMFMQLAYADAGVPAPQGDPYAGIEGLPREAAKTALSALLCRTGPMIRLPQSLAPELGTVWTGQQLSEALAQRHHPIAHLFGTGAGLRLMFTESQILVAAMLKLVAAGVPALPIHDALLVPRSKTEEGRKAMLVGACSAIGRPLPVHQKQ
jgi:hypothetical protein